MVSFFRRDIPRGFKRNVFIQLNPESGKFYCKFSFMDTQFLEKILAFKMPFGKYRNRPLVYLPYEYLLWFRQKGMPNGTLGTYLEFLAQAHEDGTIDTIRETYRRMEKFEKK